MGSIEELLQVLTILLVIIVIIAINPGQELPPASLSLVTRSVVTSIKGRTHLANV